MAGRFVGHGLLSEITTSNLAYLDHIHGRNLPPPEFRITSSGSGGFVPQFNVWVVHYTGQNLFQVCEWPKMPRIVDQMIV